jgi:hypothetical protein
MTTPNTLLTETATRSDFIFSDSTTSVAAKKAAVGTDQKSDPNFVDRRNESTARPARAERRQFGNTHQGLSEDGKELAIAIDRYKVENHRRYLTCDEMICVLRGLGYAKS